MKRIAWNPLGGRLVGMTAMATILAAATPAPAQERKAEPQDSQIKDSTAQPAEVKAGQTDNGTPIAEEGGGDDIVVTGLRESLKRAVDIKRSADNIVDSIVADDIGKLPDQNIAEAIQRVPGVTISRDNGEGQFITVRGLGPAFSTALYNGRILATENQGREFSFDILPAELINRVDVSKTPIASQIDGGIASTVDMYTARPFDFAGTKFVASGQANYDKLRGKASPQASGLFSTKLADGTIGILGAVSYIDRQIEGRRIFTDGWEANQNLDLNKDGTPEFTGVSLPTYVEYGVNSTTRKRLSGLATVQWKPTDTIVLTLDGLYSKLDVNDDNKVFFVYGGPGDITAATVDANKTITSYTGIASGPTITNQVRPRLAKTKEGGLNLDWHPTSQISALLDLSYSKATDNTGGNQAWFESNLAQPGYSPARVNFSLSDRGLPVYSGLGDILDTSNARAGYLTFEGVSVADRIYQLNTQVKYQADGGILRSLTAGANYVDRKKERFSYKTPDALQSVFSGVPYPQSVFGKPADADDFFGVGMFPGGFPTYSVADLQAYLLSDATIAATANPDATRAALAANGGGLGVVLIPSNSGSAQEKTISTFAQASLGGELGSRNWSANIGIRFTKTDVTSRGFGQEILSITTPGPGLDPIVNLSAPQPIVAKGSYAQALPTANVKIDAFRNVVFQAAVAKTLTRATLSDLLLIRNINPRPRERAITDGNPDLQPITAWNYDTALTWYIDRSSYVSIAGFYKSIKNVSESVTSTIEVLGLDFRRTRPENVGTDTYKGIELSGQYTFNGLPAPLDGLGVQANFSLVAPDATTYNVVGFYEKGPLQARIAYNYRQSYRQTEQGNRGQPVDVAAYGIWDASINYALTPNVTLFAQGLNLFNEKTNLYSVYKERTITYESYGPRYALGVRATF
ncbi:TonB-dependent receptor [Sphingomonas gellani]|uniref:TonB-dependent receptor n=1 Tax=Sphingomonas gellani TaxID=1166340 RepID=A0A1H8I004_9SPHN|nr:TonB-dependent receptor [Sphingomonas gellani]SEN61843.1 TonB-dependent receptor [Sphingomonas gellani]